MYKPKFDIGDSQAECPYQFIVKVRPENPNDKYFYKVICSADECEYFNRQSVRESKNGATLIYGTCEFEKSEKEDLAETTANKFAKALKYLPIYIERD